MELKFEMKLFFLNEDNSLLVGHSYIGGEGTSHDEEPNDFITAIMASCFIPWSSTENVTCSIHEYRNLRERLNTGEDQNVFLESLRNL